MPKCRPSARSFSNIMTPAAPAYVRSQIRLRTDDVDEWAGAPADILCQHITIAPASARQTSCDDVDVAGKSCLSMICGHVGTTIGQSARALSQCRCAASTAVRRTANDEWRLWKRSVVPHHCDMYHVEHHASGTFLVQNGMCILAPFRRVRQLRSAYCSHRITT